MIVLEHGKSTVDANGDIFRGFEVVEHACSFSSLVQGETVEMWLEMLIFIHTELLLVSVLVFALSTSQL